MGVLLWLLGVVAAFGAGRSDTPSDTQPVAQPAPSSLLTLHVKDVPLREVLKLVGDQSIRIHLAPTSFYDTRKGEEPKITLDADRRPFWLVLRKICAQSGWTPLSNRDCRVISLIQGSGLAQAPIFESEGILVTIDRVVENRVLNFLRDAPAPPFQIELSVHVPPLTDVLAYSHVAQVDEATDETGRSLAPTNQSPVRAQYTEGALIFGVRVPLELAQGEKYPTKLASLRGTIPYVVEQAAESWVIEDPQNAVNVVHDTVLEKLTFVGAKSGQNPGTYLFHSDPKTPEELKVLGNCDAEQRALLINSGGGACRTRGVDCYGGGNFEVSFVDDRGPLVPAILIVRVPTKIERRELKFEFKDVPLP